MSENYGFESWEDLLDFEVDSLITYLNDLKYVANVDQFVKNYEDLIDYIDTDTDEYTEWGKDEEFSVAEDFNYTSEEWREKIEIKCKPIIQRWFLGFVERETKSKEKYGIGIDTEYIENFWKKDENN